MSQSNSPSRFDSFDLDVREDLPLTDSGYTQQFLDASIWKRGGEGTTGRIVDMGHTFYDAVIVPNLGCALVVLSQVFNSFMVVSCKLLETDPDFAEPINPFQILFARMSITYVVCLVVMYIHKTPGFPFGPQELRHLFILRGVVGFFGVFGLYFSLQYLAVSDAVAITFLVPMVTAIAAWIMLHERYTVLEALGTITSLGGVLLIARPSFVFGEKEAAPSGDETIESADPFLRWLAISVGLLGVCGASSVYIVLKKIGKAAHPLLTVSYFALICCLISLTAILVVPSLSFAVPHTAYQWFLFVLIGISGFFMQFCLTAGVQREKAGRAALMTYSNMIFALFWDLLIWHHMPPLLSWLGFIVIIGSAFVVVYFKPTDPAELSTGGIMNGRNDLENKADDISLTDFNISDEDAREL